MAAVGIRRWPLQIRRAVLFLGLLAISSYINFDVLDIDGTQIDSLVSSAMVGADAVSTEAERVFQFHVFAPVVPQFLPQGSCGLSRSSQPARREPQNRNCGSHFRTRSSRSSHVLTRTASDVDPA